MEPFQQRYGIAVEYQGFQGPEFPPRVETERGAGQYLWDAFIGGTTSIITALKPIGALDPIQPALILPEVTDLKNWREGRIIFTEKDRLGIVMNPTTSESLFTNPTLMKADEIRSWKDLLDPKWKGKILVGRDPRVAGPGQATFTMFYLHRDLGPDFIRALAKQELTILRDDTQALQWLAEGKYPILIGGSPRAAKDMLRQGVPNIKIAEPKQLREGSYVSAGAGSIVLLNRAPHPNAARVYINWLLTQEGQTVNSKAQDLPSWRVDVPTDHLSPTVLPQPGFVETYTEEAMAVKDPLAALLQEILGR